MRRAVVRMIAGLIVLALPTTVLGQGASPLVCEHVPDILATADFLLADLPNAPRFGPGAQRSDAAYLKIRYGGLTYQQGSELLAALEHRPRPGVQMRELQLTFAKGDDRKALIEKLPPGKDPGSTVLGLGPSTLRALVLEDDGVWLFEELARWQKASPDSFEKSNISGRISRLLVDQDDAGLSRIAAKAQAAGLTRLAAFVLGSKTRLADLVAFLDHWPDGTMTTEAREGLIRVILTQRQGHPRPLVRADQPAEVQNIAARQHMAALMEPLAALMRDAPEAMILGTVVNQTGNETVATALAPKISDDIAAGRIDPRDRDAVLGAIGDGLDETLGRAGREDQLRSFAMLDDWGTSERAVVQMDAALARRALKPVVLGVAADAVRPSAASSAFDWEQWVGVAKTIRGGRAASIAGNERIAVDLLDAADRQPEALTILKSMTDVRSALARAHAMMVMLDRRCARLLGAPNAFDDPIYRFAER